MLQHPMLPSSMQHIDIIRSWSRNCCDQIYWRAYMSDLIAVYGLASIACVCIWTTPRHLWTILLQSRWSLLDESVKKFLRQGFLLSKQSLWNFFFNAFASKFFLSTIMLKDFSTKIVVLIMVLVVSHMFFKFRANFQVSRNFFPFPHPGQQ